VKVALAITLLTAFVLPLPAQAQARPKVEAPADGSTQKPSLNPEASMTEIDAAARKKAEERERAWDRKMRGTMRGICSGC
jgi:hypothetical protein